MSVKGAGNKSVAGNDNKSISSDRVNLIDLDYYSITEHITEKDLFTRSFQILSSAGHHHVASSVRTIGA
jgi:hypothetical protein